MEQIINNLLALVGGFILAYEINYLIYRWQTRKAKK